MSDANAPQLNWRDLLTLLSPNGQQQIVDFIAEARRVRGEHWLEEIQTEFPTASWIAELVANRTADEALDDIQAAYPNLPIRAFAGDKIISLHGLLKFELDKPR